MNWKYLLNQLNVILKNPVLTSVSILCLSLVLYLLVIGIKKVEKFESPEECENCGGNENLHFDKVMGHRQKVEEGILPYTGPGQVGALKGECRKN